MTSSFLRSMTLYVPSLTSSSTSMSEIPLPMSQFPSHQRWTVPKSKSITATRFFCAAKPPHREKAINNERQTLFI